MLGSLQDVGDMMNIANMHAASRPAQTPDTTDQQVAGGPRQDRPHYWQMGHQQQSSLSTTAIINRHWSNETSSALNMSSRGIEWPK